jgi:hypothetical protein
VRRGFKTRDEKMSEEVRTALGLQQRMASSFDQPMTIFAGADALTFFGADRMAPQ